jgi:hypothetical protein
VFIANVIKTETLAKELCSITYSNTVINNSPSILLDGLGQPRPASGSRQLAEMSSLFLPFPTARWGRVGRIGLGRGQNPRQGGLLLINFFMMASLVTFVVGLSELNSSALGTGIEVFSDHRKE